MKLLTKEEILSFNLWSYYFNFLNSVKDLFEKELVARLNGEKITSFVKSDFYEKDGSSKNSTSKNYPDSEDLYFQIENKDHSIGLCFYYADASKSAFDLYSKTDEGSRTLRYTRDCKIEDFLSPELVEAAVYWIKTGELSDFTKKACACD